MLEFIFSIFFPGHFLGAEHCVCRIKSLHDESIVTCGSCGCCGWSRHVSLVSFRQCWPHRRIVFSLLLQLCGMRACLFVPSVRYRGLISALTGSAIAFVLEVNEYTCAIFVLCGTWVTSCPSPASKPCELGMAFLCLLIPSDVLIQVHLF